MGHRRFFGTTLIFQQFFQPCLALMLSFPSKYCSLMTHQTDPQTWDRWPSLSNWSTTTNNTLSLMKKKSAFSADYNCGPYQSSATQSLLLWYHVSFSSNSISALHIQLFLSPTIINCRNKNCKHTRILTHMQWKYTQKILWFDKSNYPWNSNLVKINKSVIL